MYSAEPGGSLKVSPKACDLPVDGILRGGGNNVIEKVNKDATKDAVSAGVLALLEDN